MKNINIQNDQLYIGRKIADLKLELKLLIDKDLMRYLNFLKLSKSISFLIGFMQDYFRGIKIELSFFKLINRKLYDNIRVIFFLELVHIGEI